MTTVMTRMVARVLLIPSLLVALAVLVKGYADVGDGFSAGVIAGTGILVQYASFGYREVEDRLRVIRFAPALAFVGLLFVLGVLIVPLLLGDPILTHYPRPGETVVHIGTVELITPVLFDIGVFFLVFGFLIATASMLARTADRGE